MVKRDRDTTLACALWAPLGHGLPQSNSKLEPGGNQLPQSELLLLLRGELQHRGFAESCWRVHPKKQDGSAHWQAERAARFAARTLGLVGWLFWSQKRSRALSPPPACVLLVSSCIVFE
jgi:hypothetical protein